MNKLLVSALSCVLLSACSAPGVKDSAIIQQTAIEQAKTITLSPQQVLDETRDLQVLAQREDLYFYSPNYIAQAEDEIRQAETAFKEKQDPQQIIAHALTGQQFLRRGLETKETVLVQLKLALDGLTLLTELKADTLLASEFSDIQGETKELIIFVEQGNTTEALKGQGDILKEIALLEIKVLKKTFLNQAQLALNKAEDAGAEDNAVLSFEQANVAIGRLKTFIETNPKERQVINEKTQETVRLCQHAQNVAETAKSLLDLKPESAEQHVLFIEKLIARIGTALKQEDVSHLPLDNQSIAIAQAAETINKQAQAIKQQGQWETEKAELQNRLSLLQSQLDSAIEAAKAATLEPKAQEIEKAQEITEENNDTLVPPLDPALVAPVLTPAKTEVPDLQNQQHIKESDIAAPTDQPLTQEPTKETAETPNPIEEIPVSTQTETISTPEPEPVESTIETQDSSVSSVPEIEEPVAAPVEAPVPVEVIEVNEAPEAEPSTEEQSPVETP
ncbi:MAG: hypothetical protein V7785_16335 [Bermanella sp.]